jgi:hypothetical protein
VGEGKGEGWGLGESVVGYRLLRIDFHSLLSNATLHLRNLHPLRLILLERLDAGTGDMVKEPTLEDHLGRVPRRQRRNRACLSSAFPISFVKK